MAEHPMFEALRQARDVRNRIDLLIPKLDQAIETIQGLAVATERQTESRCHCGRALVGGGTDPWCEGCNQSAKVCDWVSVD